MFPIKAVHILRFMAVILLGGLHFAASAVASVGPQSARSQVTTAIVERGLVGAVWSTVAPDGSIIAEAAGLNDAPTRKPMRANDKVQVGSITKTLLATGILRLVSEGRLHLDAPVTELLPDVAIDNRWVVDSPLRLRHLLDHSSGLEDARLWQVFSLKASPDTPLGEAVGAPLRLRSRPGGTFSYSNTGYTLLGMVIERVVGERYESYLDRTLLAPLGMNDSTFNFVTQASDSRLAMGHSEKGTPQPAVPFYVRPASQFTTTANDMALFARFLLGDGSIGGRPFINSSLMLARGRPRSTDAALAGLESGYALGLWRQQRGGAVGFCHGGDTVGYRAMLCVYPQQRKAFFRSVNADVEGADYRGIDAMLVRAHGIPNGEPAAAAAMPRDIADWEGIYVPSPARFETFAYLDHVLTFVTFSLQGDRLRLKPFQADARMLVPLGGRLFRREDRVAASHVLLVDRDGNRVISIGDDFQSFRKIEWWRIGSLWLSFATGVLGLGYVLVVGLVRAAKRTLGISEPLLFPFLAVVALAIPVPLFLTQSFLAMGDLTPASGALAVVTGLLPLAMTYGLMQRFRTDPQGRLERLEIMAMAGGLQWTIVLFAWGLLPLRLWV